VAGQVHDGSPPSPPPRLVVPAYFHPAVHPGDWEWLARHASRVRLVILNIHNGPGSGPEAPFKDMTECLRAAGVPVIGYVDTDYGNRPAGQISTELGRYLDWYDVSGVCLDRAATSAASLAYYAALSARVRKLGPGRVLQPWRTDEDSPHADLLGAFEVPGLPTARSTCRDGRGRGPARSFTTSCIRYRPNGPRRPPGWP
jgi:hypothetical protein